MAKKRNRAHAKTGDRARLIGERGYLLAATAATDLGWAFERFDTRDRGLDACIALAHEDARLTGRLIAAQVKGGESWFRQETEEGFVFYEDLEHFEYWMECSLPVVILLSDLEKKVVYWVAVTPATVQLTPKGRKIVVPRDQVLDESSKAKLIELANSGPSEAAQLLADEVQRLRDRYSAGERFAAVESLVARAQGALWRFTDPAVRANAYVDLAVWSIETTGDVAAAKAYAERAKAEGAKDVAFARAVIASREHGSAKALEALGEPLTQRSYDFFTWLRLETEGVEGAKRVIDERPAAFAPTASSLRVQSLVQFVNGDHDEALKTVRLGLDRAPSNWWLRLSPGVLQLASAIASPDLDFLTTDAPMPIIPAAVNHDRDSVQRIREAASTFAELERATDDAHLAASARAWRVACLACDPDTHDETNDLIAEMLKSAETVVAAVPWALAGEVRFDAGEVFRRVSAVIETEPKNSRAILAAFNVLLTSGQTAAAAQFLKKPKQLLRKFPGLAAELEVHLNVEQGKFERASQIVSGIADEEQRRRLERIIADGQGSNWEASAALHETEYSRTGKFEHLLSAANQRRLGNDWQWILVHADALLAGAVNEYTVGLTAEAARRLRRADRRAEILERWLSVTAKPTPETRRMWITSLLQVDPPRAAKESDRLLHEAPSAEHAYLAMQAFVRVLDLKRVSIAARTLIQANDADVPMLLGAAMLTLLDEPATSRKLVRRAIELGITDADVPAALTLANKHRLKEAAELFDRLAGLASESGPIRPVTPNQLAQLAEQKNEAVNDAVRGYFGAIRPMHHVSHVLGLTMGQWIHEALLHGEHLPLLTRFGAIADRDEDLTGRRMHMDVSALLIAAELKLLDLVEQTYAPIFVSVHVGPALYEQQRVLSETIPGEEAAAQIRSLIVEGKLQTLPSTQSTDASETDEFAEAAPSTAFFVDLLQAVGVVPESAAARVVDLRSFVAELRQRGILTVGDVTSMDGLLPPGDGNVLPANTANGVVVLSWPAASAMAEAGLLGRVCARRRVAVTAGTAARSRALAAAVDRRKAAKAFVSEVAERVRDGYDRGIYRSLVSGSTVDLQDVANFDGAALHDLINAKLTSQDVVWIDDRAASRLRLSAPIIGIIDVLGDLRKRNVLNDSGRIAALATLRNMGARYLPLDPGEITERILANPVLEEFDSAEMMSLSRYLAATAIDAFLIRSSEPAANEMTYVLGTSRKVAIELPTIWQRLLQLNEDPAPIAAAIVERLYVSSVGVTALFDAQASSDRLSHAAAIELARFYQLAIPIAIVERTGAIKEGSATRTFAHWVTRSFAIRRFRSDPDVATLTAMHMRRTVEQVQSEFPPEGQPLFQAVVSLVFTLLPPEIQAAAFRDDPAYWRTHGVEVAMVARVGTAEFTEAQFWSAVEMALADAAEGTSEIELTLEGESSMVNDRAVIAVAHPSWRVQLEKMLRDTKVFDIPRDERLLVWKELEAVENARDRFAIVTRHRDRSLAAMYGELAKRMSHPGSLDETALIVPASSIANHLRLPRDSRNEMSAEAWRSAASDLAEELQTAKALRRLIALPLPISESLVQRFAADQAFETIIQSLAKNVTAPVPMMQLAAICLRCAASHPELLTVARDLVGSVLNDEYARDSFATFEAILFAVSSWLSYDAEAHEYAAEVRYLLAWYHAARLHELFSEEAQEKVRSFFASIAVPSRDSIRREASLQNALAPHYLDHPRTVFLGLASLLANVPGEVLSESGVAQIVRQALLKFATPKEFAPLLFDPSLFRGGHDSIVGTGGADAIGRVAGETLPMLESGALHQAAAALVDSAEGTPDGPSITALGFLLRQLPLYEDLRPAFRNAGAKVEESIRAGLHPYASVALTTLADQYASWGVPGDAQRLEELLIAHLRRADDTDAEVAVLANLSTVFAISSMRGTTADGARELARLIERVIEVAPSIGYGMALKLSAIIWWLPVEQSGPLWRIALRARERALGLKTNVSGS